MTIEIVDFPMKNGDFPVRYVSLPEGIRKIQPQLINVPTLYHQNPGLPAVQLATLVCQRHDSCAAERLQNRPLTDPNSDPNCPLVKPPLQMSLWFFTAFLGHTKTRAVQNGSSMVNDQDDQLAFHLSDRS